MRSAEGSRTGRGSHRGYHPVPVSRATSYAVVLAVSVVTTFALTPLVRWLALRSGAVQVPDADRVHEKTTAVLGGVAMYAGFAAGLFTAWRLGTFADLFRSSEPVGVLAAATVIVVIGHIDDLKDVSAPAKMAGSVLAASVLVLFGVSMFVLRVPFAGLVQLTSDWSYLLSVVWVVAMCHAINFIDGLDGLAAGIVGIAATVFFLYTMKLSDQGFLSATNIGPLIALLVVGMCLGFLPWNVHPAKIFMGDGGALMLGVLMGSSTMVVGGRVDQAFTGQSFFFYAPLVIPLLVLGVPIFDTAFAIVRRTAKRTSPATRDLGHLHNRLIRLGHGHRRTVFILWAWTALLSAFVLVPVYTGRGDGVVPLGLGGLALLLYTVLHPSLRIWSKDEHGPQGEPAVAVPAGLGRSAGSTPAATGGAKSVYKVPAREAATLAAELREPMVVSDGRQIRKKAARQRAERRGAPPAQAPRPRRKR